MKLYLPGKGDTGAYPLLQPALTRPVRWDIIEPQYDSMIKYATAIRLGTASTEAILRRFTKDVTHPAYAAMLETGRAQRTIFLARWLRDRDLQRETSSGLNVVENYNGVNDYIHFGKRAELASCSRPFTVSMKVTFRMAMWRHGEPRRAGCRAGFRWPGCRGGGQSVVVSSAMAVRAEDSSAMVLPAV